MLPSVNPEIVIQPFGLLDGRAATNFLRFKSSPLMYLCLDGAGANAQGR